MIDHPTQPTPINSGSKSETIRGSLPQKIAVWVATGLGVGLLMPAPGTFGALWGLPLAWLIGRMPGVGWQILATLAVNLAGIPLTTAAGRALGGKKDNQAIVWDELATMPIVFLLVPLANWKIGAAGFLLHRLCDITKPPPARHLERLPEGLGVMADDWVAAVYAALCLTCLAWVDVHFDWSLLANGG
jgi:phosphatidylglycerophosphatase A